MAAEDEELEASFFIWTVGLGLIFIVYLLFFSRLFGFFVTFVIKFFLPKQRSLRIGAVSMGLLGGRIFLKNLQYTTPNTSLQAADVIISILWFKKQPLVTKHPQFGDQRLRVKLSGVEYSIYNNTWKYDHLRELQEEVSRGEIHLPVDVKPEDADLKVYKPPGTSWETNIPGWYKFFGGVDLVFEKTSMMIGNPALKVMTVVNFETGEGVYKLGGARSALDWYTNVLDITANEPVVKMIPNPDYDVEIRKKVGVAKTEGGTAQRGKIEDFFSDALNSFKTFFKDVRFAFFSQDNVSTVDSEEDIGGLNFWLKKRKDRRKREEKGRSWHGLNRYTDDGPVAVVEKEEDGKAQPKHVEQVDATQILTAEKMFVRYFFDSPGLFPEKQDPPDFDDKSACEQGCVVNLRKGKLVYGPQADHCRDMLQRFFYPWDFRNIPIYKPKPGGLRDYTRFDVKIIFDDDGEIFVPVKRYAAFPELEAEEDCKEDVAWHLKIDVAQGSEVLYGMSWQVAEEDRCFSMLRFHLEKPDVQTSFNHMNSFIKSYSIDVTIDMPYPIVWNDLYDWKFQIKMSNPVIFYSTDHLNFLYDLIWDFTIYEPGARPDPSLITFCPTKYTYDVSLENATIYLRANAWNVVDQKKSNDLNATAMIKVTCPKLKVIALQSWMTFDAKTNESLFDVSADSLNLYLNLPANSGDILLLESGPFMKLNSLKLDGNYLYHNKVHPDYVDTSTLNLDVSSVSFRLLSPVVTGLANVYDNLFGTSRMSISVEKFLAERRNDRYQRYLKLVSEQPLNRFETFLALVVRDCHVDLPRGVHGGDELSGRLQTYEVSVELRSMPRYMDVVVDFAPVTLVFPGKTGGRKRGSGGKWATSGDSSRVYVGVEDARFHYHAMYTEGPDYEMYRSAILIHLGNTVGHVMPYQLTCLDDWMSSFNYHSSVLKPYGIPVDSEVHAQTGGFSTPKTDAERFCNTSIQVLAQPVELHIKEGDGMVRLGIPSGFVLISDNLATPRYESKYVIHIPEIAAIQLVRGYVISEGAANEWIEVGHILCGVAGSGFLRTPVFNSDPHVFVSQQWDFLRGSDADTKRLAFLWSDVAGSYEFKVERSEEKKEQDDDDSVYLNEIDVPNEFEDDDMLFDAKSDGSESFHTAASGLSLFESSTVEECVDGVENSDLLYVFELDLDEEEEERSSTATSFGGASLFTIGLEGRSARSRLPVKYYHRFLRRYQLRTERRVLTPASVARKSQVGVLSPFPMTAVMLPDGNLRGTSTVDTGSSFLRIRRLVPRANRRHASFHDPVSMASEVEGSFLRDSYSESQDEASMAYEYDVGVDDGGFHSTFFHFDFTKKLDALITPESLELSCGLVEKFKGVSNSPWSIMGLLEKELFQLRNDAPKRNEIPFTKAQFCFSIHSFQLKCLQAIRYAPLQMSRCSSKSGEKLSLAPKLATSPYLFGLSGSDIHGYVFASSKKPRVQHIDFSVNYLDLTVQELVTSTSATMDTTDPYTLSAEMRTVPLERLPARIRDAARKSRKHALLLALSVSNAKITKTLEDIGSDSQQSNSTVSISATFGDLASAFVDRSMLVLHGLSQAWMEAIMDLSWSLDLSEKRRLAARAKLLAELNVPEIGRCSLESLVTALKSCRAEEIARITKAIAINTSNLDRRLVPDSAGKIDTPSDRLTHKEIANLNMRRLSENLHSNVLPFVEMENRKSRKRKIDSEEIPVDQAPFSLKLSLERVSFWVVDTAPLNCLIGSTSTSQKFDAALEADARFIHGIECSYVGVRGMLREKEALLTEYEFLEKSRIVDSSTSCDHLLLSTTFGRMRLETSPGVMHIIRYATELANRVQQDFKSKQYSANELPSSAEIEVDATSVVSESGKKGTEIIGYVTVRELQAILSAPSAGMFDIFISGFSVLHSNPEKSPDDVVHVGLKWEDAGGYELMSEILSENDKLLLLSSTVASCNSLDVKFRHSSLNEMDPHVICLLAREVSSSSFLFERNSESEHLGIFLGLDILDIDVPFSESWNDSISRVQRFMQLWQISLNQTFTSEKAHDMAVSESQGTRATFSTLATEGDVLSDDKVEERRREDRSSVSRKERSLALSADMRGVTISAALIHQLSLKHEISRLCTSATKTLAGTVACVLHLFPNEIVFSSGEASIIPASSWPGGTSRDETVSSRRIKMPQAWISLVNDPSGDCIEQRVEVTLECIEDVITSDVLQHVLSVRKSLSGELDQLIKNAATSDEDSDQSEVDQEEKRVHLLVRANLQGLYLTIMSSCTALVYNSGATYMHYEETTGHNPKWIGLLRNFQLKLIDPEHIEWSDNRLVNGRFSDASSCFVWGSVRSDITVQNYHDCISPAPEGYDAPLALSKVFLTIMDTNVMMRPGSLSQVMFLVNHYSTAVASFQAELAKQEVSDGEQRLLNTANEYIENLGKHMTLQLEDAATAGELLSTQTVVLVRFLDVWVCVPIGDTPFVIPRAKAASAHILIDNITSKLVFKEAAGGKEESGRRIRLLKKGKRSVSQVLSLTDITGCKIMLSEGKGADSTSRPPSADINKAKRSVGIDKIHIEADSKSSTAFAMTFAVVDIGGPVIDVDASAIPLLLDVYEDWRHPMSGVSMASPSKGGEAAEGESGSTRSNRIFWLDCSIVLNSGSLTLRSAYSYSGRQASHFMGALRAQIKRGSDRDSSKAELLSIKLPSLNAAARVRHSHSQTSDAASSSSRSDSVPIFVSFELDVPDTTISPLFLFFVEEVRSKLKRRLQERQQVLGDMETRKQQRHEAKSRLSWMKAVRVTTHLQRAFRSRKRAKTVRELYDEGEKVVISDINKIILESSRSQNLLAVSGSINPFNCSVTCSPVADSDVVLNIGLGLPIDVFCCSSKINEAVISTASLVLPDFSIRLHEATSPADCFSFSVSDALMHLHYGIGVRMDSGGVASVNLDVEHAEVTTSLDQMAEYFVFRDVWIKRAEEVQQAIADAYYFVEEADHEGSNRYLLGKVQIAKKRPLRAISNPVPTVAGVATIHDISLNTKLGQIVGDQEVSISPVNLQFLDMGSLMRTPRRDGFLTSLLIGNLTAQCTGHLGGSISLQGLGMLCERFYPAPPGGGNLTKGMNKVRIGMKPLDVDMEYDSNSVLTAHLGDHALRFRDRFEKPYDGSVYHIESVVSSDGMEVKMSRDTLTTVDRISKNLQISIAEQEGEAQLVVSRYRKRQKAVAFLEREDTESSIPGPPATPSPNGDVTFLGRRFDVSLYRDSFLDPQFLHLFFESVRLNVAIFPKGTIVQRGLSLYFGENHIQRSNVRAQPADIVKIVGGLVEMMSKENPEAKELVYMFTSKFRDNITVTTNITEYNFMRDVIDRLTQAVPSLPSTLVEEEPTTKLKYTAKKFELQPAISVLGDFTPRVGTVLGWMGIEDHENVIPRATHESISCNMETLLGVCCQISRTMDKLLQ